MLKDANRMTTFTECLDFEQLTTHQLYHLCYLRQIVFVVEQDCPYLDCDFKDQSSHHLMIWADSSRTKLLAYARLLPQGISYPDYASIGRVVNAPDHRREGLGKALMMAALRQMNILYPHQPIKISAQTYLLQFYENLGFRAVGDVYLEDNINHIAMVHTTSK